ncbi:hypothetical protein BCR37DRAFT_280761 [Protomyces lactucae-debilis]|uniref:C3H1-type domain-containing protein n=1 Tax=Protomyces lactucae-debilis TaxID=2754530 RepID=A0A1Y2FM25_PROLT|nr:uncharacterized protein BCR37DRAFT_280761 [Protomyces lactucae-debilis]ORY83825.1 hypothetical protein BCR37DRAFT_280761 [Protomyces lactucae-debilis]
MDAVHYINWAPGDGGHTAVAGHDHDGQGQAIAAQHHPQQQQQQQDVFDTHNWQPYNNAGSQHFYDNPQEQAESTFYGGDGQLEGVYPQQHTSYHPQFAVEPTLQQHHDGTGQTEYASYDPRHQQQQQQSYQVQHDGYGVEYGQQPVLPMQYSHPYGQTPPMPMQQQQLDPSLHASQDYAHYESHPRLQSTGGAQYEVHYEPPGGGYRPQAQQWQPTLEQRQQVQKAQQMRLQSIDPGAIQAQGTTAVVGQNKPYVLIKSKGAKTQVKPTSPPRPTDPLGALRHDVSQCLSEYNTSRDPKACAATLLSLMTTCDQPADPAASTTAATASPDPSKPAASTSMEHFNRQFVLLSTMIVSLRPSMVQELSEHVSIRARLRGWLVKAQRENHIPVLQGIAQVLASLDLDAAKLAHVKLGKPIMIVARKTTDPLVKQVLGKMVGLAEQSLVLQAKLEAEGTKAPALVDDVKPKKSAAASKAPKLEVPGKVGPVKKVAASLPKKAEVKKVELKKPEAKINTSFFKKDKEAAPTKEEKGTELTKNSVLSALAGMKARKKSDVAPVEAAPAKPQVKISTLVEGLKRTLPSSTTPPPESTEPVQKRRKLKRVRWRPDDELEQVKIFEKEEPEYPEEPAGEHGSARDLDRKEGAFMHAGLAFDRDEDFLAWEEPPLIAFTQRELAADLARRGPKRAGTLIPHSKEAQIQEERERGVFLTIYTDINEIPPSPAEPNAATDEGKENNPPKMIPLPTELRQDPRNRQVLGSLALPGPNATPPAANTPAIAPTSIVAEPSVATNAFSAPVAAASPDITQLLAMLANQQKSTASPVPQAASVAPTPPLPQPPLPMGMPMMPGGFDPFAMGMPGMPGFPGMPPMPGLPHMPQQPQTPFQQPPHRQEQPPQQYGKEKAARGASGEGLQDVRPWVKYNTGGKYREVCKFWPIGQCRKDEQCGYLHVRE